MELEAGTITIAILSAIVLAFGFWIIERITDI